MVTHKRVNRQGMLLFAAILGLAFANAIAMGQNQVGETAPARSVAEGGVAREIWPGHHAQANRMWVVCCNAVGKECYGTSVIVGPSGEPLVVLPTDREIFGVSTINLSLGADWDRWRRRLDPSLLTPPNH